VENYVVGIYEYEIDLDGRKVSGFEFEKRVLSESNPGVRMTRPTRIHRVVAPSDAKFVKDECDNLRLKYQNDPMDAREVLQRATGRYGGFRPAE
jgi:hypothetical protein